MLTAWIILSILYTIFNNYCRIQVNFNFIFVDSKTKVETDLTDLFVVVFSATQAFIVSLLIRLFMYLIFGR